MFRAFCKYVDERIFSKENMGSYVALIIDQSFIDDFCKETHVSESTLMCDVRRNLWKSQHDDLDVKGIIAIQLYAATKRANADGITENNYRDRLASILDWDISTLQQWMIDYQEDIWLSLYHWCDNNYFRITKCRLRTGKGRYVQFPVNQALRVFTEEDLLYIAKCFVDKHLCPGEDISYTDFWKIINKYSIKRYFQTNHSLVVVSKSITDDDYLSQIYNFFLRWDGRYKYREKLIQSKSEKDNVYAYLTDDLAIIELRNENLKLLQSYQTDTITYSEISSHLNFKRDRLLLFKKDDVYENRWQEVRYIDAGENDYSKESGSFGIVVSFKSTLPTALENKLKHRCDVLYENSNIAIYKIYRNTDTDVFFTEKRCYELYGGLKIGRNVYLKGATPILRLHNPKMVWIDGTAISEVAVDGDYSLNDLTVGRHLIKLPNTKIINIDVVEPSVSVSEWQETYNKWRIGIKPAIWQNAKFEHGVVGLDFSSVSDTDNILDESIAKRWAKACVFANYHKREKNIAINLTK